MQPPRDQLPASVMLTAALVAFSITSAPAQSSPLPIREELRIGGESADLTTIHWLGVSRSGAIIAAQRMDGNLRVYDPTGRLLKVLGRTGGGPGEFGSIGLSGWTDDSLWVHDASLGRVSYVRADATLGEPRPTPTVPTSALHPGLARMSLGTAPSALYSDGSTLFKLPVQPPQGTLGGFGRREAYWLVDPKGGAKQSVLGSVGEPCTVKFEGGFIFKPFCRESILRESPDGMHLAVLDPVDDSTVEVAMMRRDGTVVWRRRIVSAATPLTSAAWDSVIASRVNPRMAPPMREAFAALKAPARLPPVRNLLVGRDGSLWIEGWGKNVRPWTVLRQDGSTLGVVTLPGRARLTVADLKQIWTIELDQDDLPSVVRYRLGR